MRARVLEAARPPDGFLELPARVYADDPRWIPEEPDRLAALLDPAVNPWFERGRARLLSVPGEARAAVFLDPALRVDGRPGALFGLFETRGDPAATVALLETAAEIARAAGARVLLGPGAFSTAVGYRLRVDRAEDAPFPGEPYNPPSYAAHLEAAGFRAVRRYVTQLLPGPVAVAAAHRGDEPLAALRADGFRVERITAERWLARLEELHHVVEEVFSEAFAYAPMSARFFAHVLGEGVARRLCPLTSAWVLDPAGAIAAFALVIPDYGPLAAQGARASRVPASALARDAHFPRLGRPRGVIKTIAVRRPFRGRGAARALLASMIDENPYAEWLGALIRDDNPSRRLAPPGVRERRYALFAREP